MNRPRRKSASVVNYREVEEPSPHQKSGRSVRKSLANDVKSQPTTTQTRKLTNNTKSKSRAPSASSESENSPIEVSSDDEPIKSRRSLRKSKSCNEINYSEDSPKKPKLSVRNRTPSIKGLESITTESSPTVTAIEKSSVRKSGRYKTPSSVSNSIFFAFV